MFDNRLSLSKDTIDVKKHLCLIRYNRILKQSDKNPNIIQLVIYFIKTRRWKWDLPSLTTLTRYTPDEIEEAGRQKC